MQEFATNKKDHHTDLLYYYKLETEKRCFTTFQIQSYFKITIFACVSYTQ